MPALADRFEADLPVAEVDVTSTADLTRLVEPSDVVVSTIGPFMRLGRAAVTAAARVGAHYLDSTGEGTFARRVLRELDRGGCSGSDARARVRLPLRAGQPRRRARPHTRGERARHVETGYFIPRAGHGDELVYRSTLRDAYTHTNGGTRQTLVAAAAEDGFAYRSPGPCHRPCGRGARGQAGARFPLRRRERTVMTVPGTEHLGLPEVFPQLESVEVGLGWFGRWTRPLQIAATIQTPLSRSAKVRAALERWSERLPGSRREPDRDGRSLVIAVAPRQRPAPGHDGPHRTRSVRADGFPPGVGCRPRGTAGCRPQARRARPGRRLRPRHPQARCRRGRSTRSRRVRGRR
ncbi:hypothetical protein ABZ307_37495 [Streptomyces griseorubiginosus]